jgi:trimeric autotransporter adhesin
MFDKNLPAIVRAACSVRLGRLGAGVGIASVVLAASAWSPTGAAPRRVFVGTAQRTFVRTERRPMSRGRMDPSPMPCFTNMPGDTFIGVPGQSDYADNVAAGVVGGQSNNACDYDSVIGGGQNNTIASSQFANDSFIGAGDDNGVSNVESFVGAGAVNLVTTYDGFVGAGYGNEITAPGSSIGGGDVEFSTKTTLGVFGNIVSGADSFIGAGDLNNVSGNGSFIGGGGFTWATTGANDTNGTPGNQVSATDSFIGAGDQNNVAGSNAFIGAGTLNVIESGGAYGSIAGGRANVLSAAYGSVLGGYGNHASGEYAVVAGGDGNTAAGVLSLAAGYHADATHNGSFVWSDYSSGSSLLKDTAVNQFVARASGGVYFYSNEAGTSGVRLAPGSGTWGSLSDRNAKTGIVALDEDSILAKVVALPIDAWQYKSEAGVRHVGPMAQDFYAAFGVGEDDRHITSIDEDGIALAAIKALHREHQRLSAAFNRSQDSQRRDDARLAVLGRNVDRLDAAVATLLRGS